MECLIRKSLLAWVLLLGALLLTQVLPLPRAVEVGYALVWVVMFTSPLAGVLILGLVVMRLREARHRLRVLRRARHWHRRQEASGQWMDTGPGR
jgi:fumarate reductase subunit D